MFQSSPGPKAERCLGEPQRGEPPQGVSILARPEGRALPFAVGTLTATDVFQSSPGPKAERCTPDVSACRGGLGFNPRPARRPSAAGFLSTVGRRAAQRFNPRPARRPSAAEFVAAIRPTLITFQSSPGPKAERCGRGHRRQEVRLRVSILARPEGRALPVLSPLGSPECPRFNPRPARRPSAALICGDSEGHQTKFQSSPGPKAERCAVIDAADCDVPRVSILARPEGRALRDHRGFDDIARLWVSILARPEGRALPGSIR